jgi:uncharacterized sulfatase
MYGQHVSYMFETPTTQVWKRRFDAGKLTAEQARFWREKPAFELYDLQTDPDEVHNLAESPQHRELDERLSLAHAEHTRRILDVGFLPEDELHNRWPGKTPYEAARGNKEAPAGTAWLAAEAATKTAGAPMEFLRLLGRDFARTDDSGARFWFATGILVAGREAVAINRQTLYKALSDSSPSVRVVAAEALGRYGNDDDLKKSLEVLKELVSPKKNGVFVSMAALNALGELGEKAQPALSAIEAAGKEKAAADQRYQSYVPRLVEKLTAELKR